MAKDQILPDALYTTEEAGDLMGLSPLTIQKYIREKQIEATKIGGKWYRIAGKELLRFIENYKGFAIIPDSLFF
jgi:excisionase family DNA binding protein